MGIIEKLLREHNVKHITQIDPGPDRENPNDLLRLVNESGTDAVIFAGTSITPSSLLDVLTRAKEHIPDLPKIYGAPYWKLALPEILTPLITQDLVDGVMVYDVENAEKPDHTIGWHKDWHKYFYEKGEVLPTDFCEEVAYIILSKRGTIRDLILVKEEFGISDIVGYACVGASRHSIIYLETTGFESEEFPATPCEYIREIRRWLTTIGLKETRILSGGEIKTGEEARKRLEAGADYINIGNPLYEDKLSYLDTIRAVKPNIAIEFHKQLLKLYSS